MSKQGKTNDCLWIQSKGSSWVQARGSAWIQIGGRAKAQRCVFVRKSI